MAIRTYGYGEHNKEYKENYKGAVIGSKSKCWLDGMDEEWAVVWDMENHLMKEVIVYYGGIDGRNQCNIEWEIDLSVEVARDIIRTLKTRVNEVYARSVVEEKNKIDKGRTAEVTKGRKVKKGTILEVFWVGEKPTYFASRNPWCKDTELIAGCNDANGNKIWIKAEYLKNLTEIKSPNANERKKFMQNYIKNVIAYDIVTKAKGSC